MAARRPIERVPPRTAKVSRVTKVRRRGLCDYRGQTTPTGRIPTFAFRDISSISPTTRRRGKTSATKSLFVRERKGTAPGSRALLIDGSRDFYLARSPFRPEARRSLSLPASFSPLSFSFLLRPLSPPSPRRPVAPSPHRPLITRCLLLPRAPLAKERSLEGRARRM